MEASNLGQFFSGIESCLPRYDEVTADNIRDLVSGLTPKLEAARELDKKMNQVFAHRFNVLDYLRTDELGLSRIIADLFNPNGKHGQGASFLQSFLNKLRNEENCVVDSSWPDLRSERISVAREKTIEDGRKVDIYVKIESNSGRYCLAIENKPYAEDQHRQVADYLKHLREGYDKDKFVLIYLSPRGEFPSESSLKTSEYRCWSGQFLVMAYCIESTFQYSESDISDSDSEFDSSNTADSDTGGKNDARREDQYIGFDIKFTLADWFAEYREKCEVDRLRSFLLDAKNFCEIRFGGQNMANESETQAVREFILQDKNHIRTARIISESFETLKYEICKSIFEEIYSKIAAFSLENGFENPAILLPPRSPKRNASERWYLISLFRKNYGSGPGPAGVRKQDGIGIVLHSSGEKFSMNRWMIGIRIANRDQKDYKKYQIEIVERIFQKVEPLPNSVWNRNRNNNWQPLTVFMDESYNSWYTNLPTIVEAYNKIGSDKAIESSQHGLVSYYVKSITNMASESAKIIDDVLQGRNVSEL